MFLRDSYALHAAQAPIINHDVSVMFKKFEPRMLEKSLELLLKNLEKY